MDQQQEAFLLQVSRQLETVLAACKQNGTAEVLIGSNRHANKLLQVKLVAEEKVVPEVHTQTDAQSQTQAQAQAQVQAQVQECQAPVYKATEHQGR